MNILSKNSLLVVAAISFGINSYGAISVEIQADLLQNAVGNGAPTNSLAILVVDTGGNGFARIVEGQPIAAKALTSPGGDDFILGKWDLSVFDTPGVLSVSDVIDTNGIPGLAAGNALALMWLPAATLNNTTFITGQAFGTYTRATPANGSDPWTMPSLAGGSRSLGFYTTNGQTLSPGSSAANPASAGLPSNTVAPVPEPTSVGLLTLGLAGLAARRRRA